MTALAVAAFVAAVALVLLRIRNHGPNDPLPPRFYGDDGD